MLKSIASKQKILIVIVALLFVNNMLAQSTKQHNIQHLIEGSSVLNKNYQQLVYKANMDIYKRGFSGVYLFKKQEADTSFRIVMLSEFGLTYFDFEYKNKQFKIKNCQEFFNKPMLLKLMQNHIRLLLTVVDNPTKIKQINNSDTTQSVYKFKFNYKKYYYFYDFNSNLKKIVVKKNMFSKTQIHIDNYNNDIPKNIKITHNRQKIKLSLKLLEVKK